MSKYTKKELEDRLQKSQDQCAAMAYEKHDLEKKVKSLKDSLDSVQAFKMRLLEQIAHLEGRIRGMFDMLAAYGHPVPPNDSDAKCDPINETRRLEL